MLPSVGAVPIDLVSIAGGILLYLPVGTLRGRGCLWHQMTVGYGLMGLERVNCVVVLAVIGIVVVGEAGSGGGTVGVV